MYIMGKVTQRLPTYSTQMWSVEVHQDLDIGPPTRSCSLDIPLPDTHPCLLSTVDSTKPLVLFYSSTERVPETRHIRVSMESRPSTGT